MSAEEPVDRLFPRILVPTDFSPASEEAWRTAQRLALALGSELVLVHVLVQAPLFSEAPFAGDRVRATYETARAWAEKRIQEWASAAQPEDLTVRTLLRTGVPHREILAAAADERAALIVMGTRGLGGLDRALLGSVTDRVVRLAPCPVLTLRD
jgi:nucleotide-binding universal stress UspA family protein